MGARLSMGERMKPPGYYEKSTSYVKPQRGMGIDRPLAPGPILDSSPVDDDAELTAAIENFELHWRNCVPLAETRIREGMPIVTREELQAKLEVKHMPFIKKPT